MTFLPLIRAMALPAPGPQRSPISGVTSDSLKRRAVALGLACVSLCAAHVSAQDVTGTAVQADTLSVFIDCTFTCDLDYIRTEIPIVNYARDRADADVHVLVSRQPTGGGTEYQLAFIGLNRFSGSDASLTYVALEATTDDERRAGIVRVLRLGLVRYLAETPLADQIDITIALPSQPAALPAAADPWNLWVFRISLGGTVSGERANTGHSIRSGVSANRTTDAWKLSFSAGGNYRDDEFELGEAQTFKSISRSLNVSALAVRSLSEHWSAGVVGNASSSTFLNYDLRTRLASGVEYNFFPYSQSTRRMLTLQYTVGLGTADYREETIFGETSERLVDHRAGLALTLLQPWGTGTAEITGSQYLSRPDQYNVTAFGSANVRLFRGFALSVFATLSRTNDQIYLPRSDASTEEILVRERQLATSYRYTANLGLTYSFGSRFNNVVNPRFGSTGDEFAEF